MDSLHPKKGGTMRLIELKKLEEMAALLVEFSEDEALPPKTRCAFLRRAAGSRERRGGDLARAEQLVREALEIDPENEGVLVRLDRFHPKPDYLIGVLRKRAELASDPTEAAGLYLRILLLYTEIGDSKGARATFALLRDLLVNPETG